MSEVNPTQSLPSNYYINRPDEDKKDDKEEKSNDELGQSAFLELMITQLNNQDPLSPQENGEFIAQLAQFSSVEGIERLNGNFESFNDSFLSNQALQASSLVGRAVSVPAEKTSLDPNGIVSGSFELPTAATNVSVNVYSEAGALVQTIPLGTLPSGEQSFRTDGLNFEVNGEIVDWTSDFSEDDMPEKLEPGVYRYEVTAVLDGEATQVDTALSANVNSVTVNPEGELVLNLAVLGSVKLSDVKQFN